MKKLIQRLRYKLPRYYRDVFWNRSFYTDERFPMVNFENYGYVDCEKGVIVPMKEVKPGYYAYYEVVGVSKSSGSDWIRLSDRWNADMKFAFIKKGTGIIAPEKKYPRFLTW